MPPKQHLCTPVVCFDVSEEFLSILLLTQHKTGCHAVEYCVPGRRAAVRGAVKRAPPAGAVFAHLPVADIVLVRTFHVLCAQIQISSTTAASLPLQ